MKCCCCDKTLSDYESTLKHRTEGYYLDMCVKCLKGLSIPAQGRDDLLGAQQAVEDLEPEEFSDESSMHYDEHFNDDIGPMFEDD